MSERDRERVRYFQAISRNFLALRGAPFFLSSRDLDLISRWEEAGIPLSVVLEGIDRSFDTPQKKPRARGKIRSLSFCSLQVERNYEQYQERRTGKQLRKESREEKRKRVQEEVRKFLARIPEEVKFLRDIFAAAERILGEGPFSEDELEKKEAEVEERLLQKCVPEVRAHVEKETASEYKGLTEDEFQMVLARRLARFLRDKHRIPYLSLYYY